MNRQRSGKTSVKKLLLKAEVACEWRFCCIAVRFNSHSAKSKAPKPDLGYVALASMYGAIQRRVICKLKLNRSRIRFPSVWIYFSQLKNLPQHIISISLCDPSAVVPLGSCHTCHLIRRRKRLLCEYCLYHYHMTWIKVLLCNLRIRICTKLSVMRIVWCVLCSVFSW